MDSQASLILGQVGTFVSGLERWQKVVLAGGTAAVLAGMLLVAVFMGKGEYVPLFTGLAPSEAQEIGRKLAQQGVPFEMQKDGTGINVPASRLDKVRMELAAEGYPRTGRQGFELFDKPNWMGSDFVEKVNYQRALEGELERTIQSLDEVEAVRVHVVLPHESLFSDQERAARASVVLKLRGHTLSPEKMEAIRNLFANAIDHLKPGDVTVIDADSQTPLLSSAENSGGIPKEISQIERSLSDKLVAAISPVVGAGKAKASVSVEYSLGSSDKVMETYDPNAVAVVSSQTSQMKSTDGSEPVSPGTEANIPNSSSQAPAVSADASLVSGTSQSNDNKTFAVSKSVTHTVEPAGMLKRITAAVLVDDVVETKLESGQSKSTRRKRTPEEMKQIQEVAEAVIGIDTNRGDRVVVQNLSFQSAPVETPVPPTRVQMVVNGIREWFFAIKYAGIFIAVLMVYLTLIKPVKKQLVASLAESKAAIAQGEEKLLDAAGRPQAGVASKQDADIEVEIERKLSESNSDVKRAVLLKRHLVEKVKKDPEPASRLVQGWIRQGDVR